MRKLAILLAAASMTGCALTAVERVTACRTAPAGAPCVEGRSSPSQRRELRMLVGTYSAQDSADDLARRDQGKPPRFPVCEHTVAQLAAPETAVLTDPGCSYETGNVVPYQEISGGYLAAASGSDQRAAAPVAIFTDARRTLNQPWPAERARLFGRGNFATAYGPRKNVPMFLVITP